MWVTAASPPESHRALVAVEEIRGNVAEAHAEVRFAPRNSDDLPAADLAKVLDEVAADHAGCAGHERYVLCLHTLACRRYNT